jgi:hypothetical protein
MDSKAITIIWLILKLFSDNSATTEVVWGGDLIVYGV